MAIESLLYDFGLIVFVAMLLGAIAQKIGQSPVLGFLIAGLLLGPSGFGAIANTDFISLLSEIGVILLLFYIGLELRPSRLKDIGLQALVMGSVKMVLAFFTAFFVSYMIGFRGIEAVVLGAIFAISSTTVVTKILMERKELEVYEAKIASAILIFEGMVAIVFLNYLANAASAVSVITNTLLFVFLALFIGAKVSGAMLKLIERLGHEKYITLYAFGVLLLMSYMTSTLHLSTAAGAFFAGFILSETIHAKTIFKEMELLKNLLVAVFFASFGLTALQLSIGWFEILAAVVLVGVIVFVKEIAFFLFGKMAGIPRTTYLSILLIPLGEFSLLFVKQANDIGLTNIAKIATISIIGVVISTFLVSVMLKREKNVEKFVRFFIPNKLENILIKIGETTHTMYKKFSLNKQLQKEFALKVEGIILNLIAIFAILYFMIVLNVEQRGIIAGAILLIFPVSMIIKNLKEIAAQFTYPGFGHLNFGLFLFVLAVIYAVVSLAFHIGPLMLDLAIAVLIGLLGLFEYVISVKKMHTISPKSHRASRL